MKIDVRAQVLSAESKPYNFGGNSGTSHKIRLNIEGEIYVCKSSETQVKEISPRVGETVDGVVQVVSRKENMYLELVSFE